jgi:multidrug resistance efflux pump
LRQAVVTAPVDGRIWTMPAGSGEHVNRGQAVVRLLDCGSAVVTASVSESTFNRLNLGDGARFRLLGSNREYDATVVRLAGAGASALYADMAVAASPEHLKGYDVVLAVPGLESDPEAACAVGRTGKIAFGAPMTNRIHGLLVRFGLAS